MLSVCSVFWGCSGYISARLETMLAPQNALNREDMETRRLAAASDLLNGLKQSLIARRYGVSRTTASRWQRSVVVTGVESLRKRRATGRPRMYRDGAQAHGFSGDRWTTGKLAKAIERQFGIRYDQDHVGRLMHKFGLRERKFVYEPVAMTPAEGFSAQASLST
jgi:transposase